MNNFYALATENNPVLIASKIKQCSTVRSLRVASAAKQYVFPNLAPRHSRSAGLDFSRISERQELGTSRRWIEKLCKLQAPGLFCETESVSGSVVIRSSVLPQICVHFALEKKKKLSFCVFVFLESS